MRELLRQDDGFGLFEALTISIIGLCVAAIVAGQVLIAMRVEAQDVHEAQARAAITTEAAALLTQANRGGVTSVRVTGTPVAFAALREKVTLTSWTLASNGTLTAGFTAQSTGAVPLPTITGTAVAPLDGSAQYAGPSGKRQTWTKATSTDPAIAYRVLKSVSLKGQS